MSTDWKSLIRDVPDFPKEGILFKDIMPILADADAFNALMDELEVEAKKMNPDIIVAAEARGFIFGCPLALRMAVGFAPVRKKGKLPYETITEEYELEYGTDSIQMHTDAVSDGQRVLVVDDLLATGGTAAAIGSVVKKLGGTVAGYLFCIELGFIPGRNKLTPDTVTSLYIVD